MHSPRPGGISEDSKEDVKQLFLSNSNNNSNSKKNTN